MIKKILFFLSLTLILTAAGCKGEVASIGEVNIVTQINSDNSPIGNSRSVILETTPTIYLSVEVINGKSGTSVDVEWKYVTGDRILATESFRGKRSGSQPHEFVIGREPITSYLSSKITLSKLTWDPGSYEATVKLNNQVIKRLGFNIVRSNDYEDLSKKEMFKKLYLGSKVNSEGQIAIPNSTFSQNQEEIYAVALLQNVPKGTIIQAVWEYLGTNQIITNFSTSFDGGGYLPFKIELDRFGKLWADGLWPKGIYQVSIYVDNVIVTTSNFTVN